MDSANAYRYVAKFSEQTITIVLVAVKQKVLRKMHCLECGMPIGAISDKILLMFDGETPVEEMHPDEHGAIELHCRRRTCKQRYKLEFAK